MTYKQNRLRVFTIVPKPTKLCSILGYLMASILSI